MNIHLLEVTVVVLASSHTSSDTLCLRHISTIARFQNIKLSAKSAMSAKSALIAGV